MWNRFRKQARMTVGLMRAVPRYSPYIEQLIKMPYPGAVQHLSQILHPLPDDQRILFGDVIAHRLSETLEELNKLAHARHQNTDQQALEKRAHGLRLLFQMVEQYRHGQLAAPASERFIPTDPPPPVESLENSSAHNRYILVLESWLRKDEAEVEPEVIRYIQQLDPEAFTHFLTAISTLQQQLGQQYQRGEEAHRQGRYTGWNQVEPDLRAGMQRLQTYHEKARQIQYHRASAEDHTLPPEATLPAGHKHQPDDTAAATATPPLDHQAEAAGQHPIGPGATPPSPPPSPFPPDAPDPDAVETRMKNKGRTGPLRPPEPPDPPASVAPTAPPAPVESSAPPAPPAPDAPPPPPPSESGGSEVFELPGKLAHSQENSDIKAVVEKYDSSVESGQLSQEQQETAAPLLRELETLVHRAQQTDLTPDDEYQLVKQVRNLLERLQQTLEQREFETGGDAHVSEAQPPYIAERYSHLSQTVDQIQQFLEQAIATPAEDEHSGDITHPTADPPGPGQEEGLIHEQLFSRSVEIMEQLHAASNSPLQLLQIEQEHLRPFSLEVKRFIRRFQAGLVRPRWSTEPVPTDPDTIFFSGRSITKRQLGLACQAIRLNLLSTGTPRHYGQRRWEMMQSAHVAVFDWTVNLKDEQHIATLKRCAVAYEMGMALVLGKPVVIVATVDSPLVLHIGLEPVYLERNNDAAPENAERLVNALDRAMYHIPESPSRSNTLPALRDAARKEFKRPVYGWMVARMTGMLDDEVLQDPYQFISVLQHIMENSAAEAQPPMLVYPVLPLRYHLDTEIKKTVYHVALSSAGYFTHAHEIIRQKCLDMGIEYTTDNRPLNSSTLADIWQQISAASHVIVNLTACEPALSFQLGVAHTLGKPTLIVRETQPGENSNSYRIFHALDDVPLMRYSKEDNTLPDIVEQFLREAH